ncbi:MAG: OmpA family protein [Clostridia bacterium]|nr:OmpA family protein [Clostridia bacterium]
MKYRVTTRGWIVFSLLGILLLYGIIQIGSLHFKDSSDSTKNQENQIESEIDSEENTVISVDEKNEDSSAVNEEQGTENNTDQESDAVETEDSVENTTENESDTSSENSNIEVDEIIIKEKTEIIFDKNDFELPSDAFALLDEWVSYLNTYENLKVVIEGHINGYPYYDDGPYGLNISEKRAQGVKAYFLEKGIEESRIELINKGSSDQVDKTDQMNEHYKNRRAVIYILKK